MELSNFIKKYKYENNCSQAELSRLTGIPQTTLSCWETGKSMNPSMNQVLKFAKGLNVSLADIFKN